MKIWIGIVVGLIVWLALPSAVIAQGLGVTALNFRQYLPGAQAPTASPFTIPVNTVTCNQTSPTILSAASMVWDDPDNSGKVCLYVDPGTGPLFAKVAGSLEGTLTNLAGALESPESNRAPFSRPPSAPTSLRVKR